MRIALLIGLLIMATSPAGSQEPYTDTRNFLSWAAQISEANSEAMSMIETVFEADELGVSVRDGLISVDEGEAGLGAWRARQDDHLARLRTRLEDLESGPESTPAGHEKSVATLLRSLSHSLDAVDDLLDQAEDAARRDFAGKAADDYAVFAARYSVLQQYYVGQRASLEVALESVDHAHPQHGLTVAMIHNLDSTILALELGREAFGAAASEHAVANPASEFENNRQAVETALVRAATRLQALELRFSETIEADGEVGRVSRLMIELLATYRASFDAERQGAAMFPSLVARLADLGADEMFVFADELIAYEEARGRAKEQRMQFATEL